MSDMWLLFMGACLVSNLVLEHMLGTDAVLGLSRSDETALSLALAVLVFAPLTTILGYWVNGLLLTPLSLEYLQLPVMVLTVAAGVSAGLGAVRRLQPAVYERIAAIAPLLLTNCAILGVLLLTLMQGRSFLVACLLAIGMASGLALVVMAFAAIQRRLATADVPAPFQGVAIQLITLGLFSMAFMGFTGLN